MLNEQSVHSTRLSNRVFQTGCTTGLTTGFKRQYILTSVQYSYSVADRVADIFLEPSSDALVSRLRLVRCRRLAGANRPHRLVSDHDSVPVLSVFDMSYNASTPARKQPRLGPSP